ncbi:MAG: phosphate signaling complex protein PhoU [Alphaproteobacteria bacterium]|nr:phosphate signaling complex protein PhoU [Alphaproteobacteria bacterium]
MPLSQNTHIVSAYGAELEMLGDELARLGGLVEIQLAEALGAFARRDASVSATVREREVKVNALTDAIEKRVIRLFALRQPMANDLRMTLSALKISSDLERVGDLAKNIAYRAQDMAAFAPMDEAGQVERLGALVAKQLREVLDAMSSHELEPALRVWRADDEVDEHYDALTRDVLVSMTRHPDRVGPGAHILFVGKNLERVGDHATNIAESVHFMVTGTHLEMSKSPVHKDPD